MYSKYMEKDLLNYFMDEALKEAYKAFEKDEVPIGAIVVLNNEIIGRGHNLTETTKDATNHAEIIAMKEAYKKVGDWRLENCYLFSTIEPCVMCSFASVLSRIDTIVYGAKNEKFGGIDSIVNIPSIKGLNHKLNIIPSIREKQSKELMQKYFKNLRNTRRDG